MQSGGGKPWQSSVRDDGRVREAPAAAAALAAAPAAAPTAAAGSDYRIVYSSPDCDSLSDGELHVERRHGSVSAWYQRRGSNSGVAAAEAGGDPAATNTVTVVLHDTSGAAEDAAESPEGYADEGWRQQRQQDGRAISWETNSLYGRQAPGEGRGPQLQPPSTTADQDRCVGGEHVQSAVDGRGGRGPACPA